MTNTVNHSVSFTNKPSQVVVDQEERRSHDQVPYQWRLNSEY